MRVGDTWAYHRVLTIGSWIAADDTIIVGVVEDRGGGVTLWDHGGDAFLVRADEDMVSVGGSASRAYRVFVFPLEVGSAWSSESDRWSHQVKRLEPISVPAGDFVRAFLIQQDGRANTTHVNTYRTETWLAEGVGLIRETRVNRRSTGAVSQVTYDLVEYSPAK